MPRRFTRFPYLLLSLCFITMLSLSGCSLLVDPDENALPSATELPDSGQPELDSGPVDAGMDSGEAVDMGEPDAFVEADMGVDIDFGPCGPTGCGMISASNVDDSLWDESASDDLTIHGAGVVRANTEACRLASVNGEVVTQGDGSEVCVVQVRDLTISEGSSVSVTGPRPLVIMAIGNVRIDGEIDASAHNDEPGAGGGSGGVIEEINGTGPSPGAGGVHIDDFDDGGGGGGGLCGAGGVGGIGGSAAGGAGGAALSSWTLEPLVGGSGGGRGRGEGNATTTNAGLGGAGGGALQISSLTEIEINGRLFAGGGGGLGGERILGMGSNYGSGGGGGSGGGILLEAPTVTFGDAAQVVLNGGGGGAAATNAYAGGDGHDGTDFAAPSAGGLAGGGATGASGGDGAHGDTLNGAPGEDREAFTNGAGGGGGAGCLLVRNAGGVALPSASFASPSAGAVQVLPMHTR